MRFDEQFIRQVIPDVVIYGAMPINPTFSVDSRVVSPHDIFVALAGEHHDGHSFMLDALKRGALGALIAADKQQECRNLINKCRLHDKVLVVVPDPYKALISLAMAWRQQFAIPIIGVTGSVGKTSTKEMIAQLFRTAGMQFVASRGNQNTHIGVALNILRVRSSHHAGVFEMGVNKRGEMALLAQIVQPTIGIITNIGHCHMEGLGSLQDIAIEKRDIFKYFTEKNIGIINGDQELLAAISYPHPVIKYGLKTTNQIQARKVRMLDGCMRCTLKVYKDKYDVALSKPHISAITSALIAASVGHILDIPHDKILEAVQKPVVVKGRFERRALRNGKGMMISDCYNANPESMKAALSTFHQIHTGAKKVVVLGDMLELGVNSPFWHRQIGRFFRKTPSLKKVILVGNLVKWIEKALPVGIEIERVQTWQEATQLLSHLPKEEHMILVKGSNGVGLLNLVDHYTT